MDSNYNAAQAEPWRYQKVTFPPEPALRMVDDKNFKKIFHDKPGYYLGIFLLIVAVVLGALYFLIQNSEMLMIYIAGGAGFLGLLTLFITYKFAQKDVNIILHGDAVPAMLTDFTLVSNTKTTTDSKGRRRKSTDYWLEGAVFFEYQHEWYHWEFKIGSDTKAKKMTKELYAGDIVTLLIDENILMKQKVVIYQFFGIQLQDEEKRYIDEQYFQRALTEKDPHKVAITKHINRKYQRNFNLQSFQSRSKILNNIVGLLGNAMSRTTGTTTDVEFLDVLNRKAREQKDDEINTYGITVPPSAPRYFKDYVVEEQILPDFKKPSKFWIAFIVFGLGAFALAMFVSEFNSTAILGGAAIGLVLIILAIIFGIAGKKKAQAAFDARKNLLLNGESCIGMITDIRIGRYEKYNEGALVNVQSHLKICYTFVATGNWHLENFVITNENRMNQLIDLYQEGDLISVIYLEDNTHFEAVPVSILGVNFQDDVVKIIPRADVVDDLSRSIQPLE